MESVRQSKGKLLPFNFFAFLLSGIEVIEGRRFGQNISHHSRTLLVNHQTVRFGMEKKIPIGTFKLVNANSNYEIINQLIYGAPEVKKVMILEGWTLNQIANNLQNELQLAY